MEDNRKYVLISLWVLVPTTCWSGCVQDVCKNYICMYRLMSKHGKLNTELIDGLKCTHVHLCYLTYSETGIAINNKMLFNNTFVQHIRQLKDRFPRMKLLVSYQVFDKMFDTLMSDRAKKQNFVENTAKFARNNSFDGLSIRFHSITQKSQRERDTVTSILQNMRIYLAEEANMTSLPRLIFVHLASASVHLVDHLYKVNIIHRYLLLPRGSPRVTNVSGGSSRVTNVSVGSSRVPNVSVGLSRVTNVSGVSSRVTNVSGVSSRVTDVSIASSRVTNVSFGSSRVPKSQLAHLGSPTSQVAHLGSPTSQSSS
ncbi:hypothetical protein Btru_003349 [Bulinus truncatus]|nr:hypothetical protein Btru_003349 [Bulinus truncatus]